MKVSAERRRTTLERINIKKIAIPKIAAGQKTKLFNKNSKNKATSAANATIAVQPMANSLPPNERLSSLTANGTANANRGSIAATYIPNDDELPIGLKEIVCVIAQGKRKIPETCKVA